LTTSRLKVDVVELLGRVGEERALGELLHREPLPTERLHEVLAARLDGVLPTLPREPLTDLGRGSRRRDDLLPVTRGARALHLGREDLDGIARRELGVEWHEPTVHPGTDARVPHLGVDRVGEVDRGGTSGEGDHLALGGEDEDLVLLEVDLQVGHELVRILRLGLPVDDAVQPCDIG
jgi:hypothetical protein